MYPKLIKGKFHNLCELKRNEIRFDKTFIVVIEGDAFLFTILFCEAFLMKFGQLHGEYHDGRLILS